MTSTPLTLEAVVIAVGPLVLLPGAPALDERLYGALFALFASEGVTCEELAPAVIAILKAETFWPSPAAVLAAVTKRRHAAYKANEQAERKERKRIAESDPEAYERLRQRLAGVIPPEDAPRGAGTRRII